MSSMGRPREHGPETREQLLTAAARLLDEEGVAGVSVRRLSTEVDVSSRAIYSLFGDMTGLLTELYRRGIQTMVRLHEQVPRRDDPLAEIQALAVAYRRGALEQRELYALMFERAVPSFCPDEEDIAYALRSLARVEDAVTRAIALRPRDQRDPHLVTLQLWAVVHGLASLELRGALGDQTAAASHWQDTTSAIIRGLFPVSPPTTA
jgi:AcrR family transcriptional regulator